MNKIPDKNIDNRIIGSIYNYGKLFSGGEGRICESDKSYTLYKIFDHNGQIREMTDSKISKISLLHDMDVKYMVRPINTISVDGKVIGYEMTYDESFDTVKLYQLSREEQIVYLTKIKEALEYFTTLGIIYADIEDRNILFNRDTGEILFCDVDNISIQDFSVDKLPCTLTEYSFKRGLDSLVHPYMHNLMTLKAFDLDSYFSRDCFLRKYFYRKGIKTIHSMRDIDDFNGEYALKYIRKI